MTDGGWQRDPAVALLAISRIVGGATDLTEALRQTCRELARFTGAETVSVHLLHTDLRMLVPSAAYHVPPEMLPTLMAATLPVDEQGFRESVFGSGEVAWSGDVQNDPQFAYRLFRLFPHQSGAVVPVVVDDEIAGAFYLVWWTERLVVDDMQRQTLLEIGRQVAMLLRVKRLLRDAEEQQKKAEAANERYRLLFERNLAGVLWTRPDGTIVDCNDALARLLGHESRSELVGQNARDFYVKSEDRDAMIAGLTLQGAVNNRELYWRRRDGTDVWLRVNLCQRNDGVFEGILVDVSDGKRAEEAERQATELRAIATLANAAAHEINNPLSVLMGYLTILQRQHGDPRIDRALDAGGRIRDIISRMARITRVEHFEQTSPGVPAIVDIRRSSE
ncbi:MAG: hypothetical protein DMD91_02300 [Candidatus Rokuibacteriota bacterium]|nr:MAG: hypothetical protein DMD91_02300 [Candidatus Rokubacteria bacterium]